MTARQTLTRREQQKNLYFDVLRPAGVCPLSEHRVKRWRGGEMWSRGQRRRDRRGGSTDLSSTRMGATDPGGMFPYFLAPVTRLCVAPTGPLRTAAPRRRHAPAATCACFAEATRAPESAAYSNSAWVGASQISSGQRSDDNANFFNISTDVAPPNVHPTGSSRLAGRRERNAPMATVSPKSPGRRSPQRLYLLPE